MNYEQLKEKLLKGEDVSAYQFATDLRDSLKEKHPVHFDIVLSGHLKILFSDICNELRLASKENQELKEKLEQYEN